MMNPKRWQQIRNIFDGALEHAPDERSRFLDKVCANDEEVRRKVESLLPSLDSATNFMETPAVAKVADVIEAETKKLDRGKCFGHQPPVSTRLKVYFLNLNLPSIWKFPFPAC